MIDWVAILLALTIIAALIGVFGFVAWKINMSDPLSEGAYGKKDDSITQSDSTLDKKRKDKSNNDLRRKKRKEIKKSKAENSGDGERVHVKFVEPKQESSDETDNEHEESEQDSAQSTPPRPAEETQIKKRKKNAKKLARQPSPVAPARLSSTNIKGILINKDEESPITAHPHQLPHPKFATGPPSDEVELAKKHQQQAHNQSKQNQVASASASKQTSSANGATSKKTQGSTNNGNREQPFTTVVNSRHKNSAPPTQQASQQNAKPVVSSAPVAVQTPIETPTVVPTPTQTIPATQNKTGNGVQQEALPQRQLTRPQQAPTQVNGLNGSASATKSSVPTTSSTQKPLVKVADLIKSLPTSQAVVTELMFGLDAYPLSADELDIIMHKIANKRAVIKQDWSKLQHGQKVDPQAHIGEVLSGSFAADDEDAKTNAMKRINALTEELNNERSRINDLLKEKRDDEKAIQILRNQLDSIHRQQLTANQINTQQQQQYHALQSEVQRSNNENADLNIRLTQHQTQQQPLSSGIHITSNGSTHPQIEVMTSEMKRLALVNSNLERQIKAKDELIKKTQETEDNLQRKNQKLFQDYQDLKKQLQTKDESLVKELNETRTRVLNQKIEYERRIEQLEAELDQTKRQERARLEAAANISNQNLFKEERDKFEQELNQLKQTIDSLQQHQREQEQHSDQLKTQLINENNQLKNSINQIQIQSEAKENNLRQELETLKTEKDVIIKQQKETTENEITDKNVQIDSLRVELEQIKIQNENVRVEYEQAKLQVNTLQEEISQMKTGNEHLKNQLEQIKSQNETLHNERDKDKPQNEALQLELEQIKSQVENFRTELEKANARVDSQQAELDQSKSLNETLRAELEQAKVQNDAETKQTERRLHQEHDKYKQFLLNLLPDDVRSSFVSENQDFEQWLSLYCETHKTKIETEKASLHEECNSLKRENERLQQTMEDIESQLREIEQTVQTKEELLVTDLNDKTNSLERAREENVRLTVEIKRLNEEIDRISADHDKSLNEIQSLKSRAEEGPVLLNSAMANINDELSDFMRQSSPPEIDPRVDELTELIRASKEALATQDSIVQLLDKRIDGFQSGAIGEGTHDQGNLLNEASDNQQGEQKSNS